MIERNKRYKVVMKDNSVLYRDGEWFYDGDKIDEYKLELIRYYVTIE